MNLNRILTTVIGLPIVIIVFIFGNIYLMDVLFAVIAAMSLHEYFDSFKEKAKPVYWLRIFSMFFNIINTYCTKTIYNYNNRNISTNKYIIVVFASYYF